MVEFGFDKKFVLINLNFFSVGFSVPNLIQTLSRSIPRESEIEWLSYATVVAVQMSTNMKHS